MLYIILLILVSFTIIDRDLSIDVCERYMKIHGTDCRHKRNLYGVKDFLYRMFSIGFLIFTVFGIFIISSHTHIHLDKLDNYSNMVIMTKTAILVTIFLMIKWLYSSDEYNYPDNKDILGPFGVFLFIIKSFKS